MSVNKYTTEGGLQTLANGQRIWVGTKDAHDAQKLAGTLPRDCLIAITDDEDDTIVDEVLEDDSRAVTSGAVYNAIQDINQEYNTYSYGSEVNLARGTINPYEDEPYICPYDGYIKVTVSDGVSDSAMFAILDEEDNYSGLTMNFDSDSQSYLGFVKKGMHIIAFTDGDLTETRIDYYPLNSKYTT